MQAICGRPQAGCVGTAAQLHNGCQCRRGLNIPRGMGRGNAVRRPALQGVRGGGLPGGEPRSRPPGEESEGA